MIKQATNSYLITPSLINNIKYLVSLENIDYDKIKSVLKREPQETNEAMQSGIIYEEETLKGKTNAREIVCGGAYQVARSKIIEVDEINYMIYGRIDFLKAGVIYDIKRIVYQYHIQKYFGSAQTVIYLELFPEAKQMTYVVSDDLDNIHLETYYRDQIESVNTLIREFITLLKILKLDNLYYENWRCK